VGRWPAATPIGRAASLTRDHHQSREASENNPSNVHPNAIGYLGIADTVEHVITTGG
jgi:hypothetical protein